MCSLPSYIKNLSLFILASFIFMVSHDSFASDFPIHHNPQLYVLNKFQPHDIVFLGTRHKQPPILNFISEIIAALHDSGVTHLVSFMNTPTIAIFGPSSAKRWAPLGGVVKILRGDVDYEPCFETENANCDNPQCLSGVTIDMVLEAMKALNTI